jgi:hypothetical protein
MGPASVDVYEQYGATVVSWGGRPWGTDEGALEHYRVLVDAAQERGMHYSGGAAFRTAFAGVIDSEPGFMDSVCRGLDGEPMTVPWLWDQTHGGHPAYWFCTNSPDYREYLKHQVRLALRADVDGIHIDDYAGTAGTHWTGGCFCHWCMEGFQRYLEDNPPDEDLARLGITSLDKFDYGEFLRRRGVTRERFRKEAEHYPPKIPLARDYLSFQYKASAAWVEEFRRYAQHYCGRELALSVNSSAADPKDLFIAPQVTYFCGEVDHAASELKPPDGPIFTYKLGDALGRPIACTGMGWDWAFVAANDKPGLVRTWIAQSYAFGHQFMAPVRQWAYTEERGTHWHWSRPGDWDYLYRFVRANAGLFDGYDPVAKIGVLYSNAAFRNWQRGAKDVCLELAGRNVPFRLVLAGDDGLPARVALADLADLQALVVAEPTFLDEGQAAVIAAAGELTVPATELVRLLERAPVELQVRRAEGVTVVPRVRKSDPAAPYVVHLLNRNYDAEADAVVPQGDFRLAVRDSLFGHRITSAVLHAPEAEPLRLDVAASENGVEIAIPGLGLWGILRLEHDAAAGGAD